MTNIIQSSSSPNSSAYQNSTLNNLTGDGTVYQAVFNTSLSGGSFDTSTGVFTCTIDGYFLFCLTPEVTGLTSAASAALFTLVTTLGSYTVKSFNPGGWRSQASVCQQAGYVLAPMNVNDTAYLTIKVSNTTKTIGFGNSNPIFSVWRLF